MLSITNTIPDAYAKIKGNEKCPDVKGTVSFYGVHCGTIVVTEVTGLSRQSGNMSSTFHGFHIHEGEHYNPTNMKHPNHVGDLPPLLANHGIVFSVFYTERFYPEDVLGKTIVIHEKPDDFRTQPSGDSGEMIAFGKIIRE